MCRSACEFRFCRASRLGCGLGRLTGSQDAGETYCSCVTCAGPPDEGEHYVGENLDKGKEGFVKHIHLKSSRCSSCSKKRDHRTFLGDCWVRPGYCESPVLQVVAVTSPPSCYHFLSEPFSQMTVCAGMALMQIC